MASTAVASRDRLQPLYDERNTRLAREIAGQVARKGLHESGRPEQTPDPFGEVAADFIGAAADLVHDLASTINDRDDVLQIMTAPVVAAAAAGEPFQPEFLPVVFKQPGYADLRHGVAIG